MEFRILGSLEIEASDGSPLQVSGPKQRGLLALLVIHANEVLSTDRIIDALWGEEPPSGALNSLRFHISKLRSALGDEQERLATKGPGYVLLASPGEVDAQRFESAVAEAVALVPDNPEAAVARYQDAIELWRGPTLADFEYEDFARTEIARLRELRLAAVEGRFEAELAAGRHDELVGELRTLVDEHPLRERLWASLMTALYRSGRQAEALRAYQEARSTLGDELGIEPSEELRDLEEKVLLQDESIKTPDAPRRAHNLPARVSRFVGRDQEISTIGKLLGRSRLVTLMGVGGVGKTSLALEVAGRHVDEFRDGVWLVDLATVTDATGVLVAAAEALRVRTRSSEHILADIQLRMANTEVLVILDNCEHVIAAAADLAADLLAKCPGVKILATSRELLSVPGEITFGVSPMTLGDDHVAGDAVALFTDRLEAFLPGTGLGDEEQQTVYRICRAVDGLPLAIELAAARTRALSLDEVERRLSDRFALLAGGSRTAAPRQRTLRATIDWSYDLLSDSEQGLFAVLSVLPGSFTAEAVEAIVRAGKWEDDALDLLAALVDKSLVARIGGRYYLLPTLRRYAAGKVDGKAIARTRRVLVEHYAGLASRLEDSFFATEEPQLAEHVVDERSNMRSALAWSMESGDTDAALTVAASLAFYWIRSGVWTEGWLRRGVGAGDDVPQTVQLQEGLLLLEGIAEPADALAALAQLVEKEGEAARATRLLGAAHQIRHDLGHEPPRAEDDLAGRLELALGKESFDDEWQAGRTVAQRR
ncbi:MAG: BTAD domain-containing putative transcriptional regulator [Acidimicrobiia bacterium]|nr:BTAD domain-containing putative transcriptional regulator [Acidimicrobiia bacterium]